MWLRGRNSVTSLEAITKFSRLRWIYLFCSYSSIPHKKTKLAPLQERKMIDRFRLWAKGGDGGNGCSCFRRSRNDRRGTPDGGNGGKGGDVILECSPAVWDFSSLQHHINARRGGHGAPKNMIGSRGSDKVIMVPTGTVIHLIQGELPRSLEKSSTGPLDPWEIPGKLDSGSSEFCQQSPTENSWKVDMANTENTIESLAPPSKGTSKELARGRGPRCVILTRSPASKGKPQNEAYAHRFQKTRDYRNCEDLDGETSMSASEEDEDFEESEEIEYNVAELTEPGQRITIAQGGNGGLGNIRTARGSKFSNANDMDITVSDDEDPTALNIGQPGSETILLLELKVIADVGLVGLPNAGKSTLLGAISRAKPRVGHFAFTTLRPNLGNMSYDDLSITIADVPGLIRGAHENRGLGHAFLRHIERTKVLAYVLDLAAAGGGRKGLPPWEQLRDLLLELELYSEGLSDRPCLVVANKIDEDGAEQVFEELKRRVTDVPVFPVCAVLEEGIEELKDGLKALVRGEGASRLKLENIVVDFFFLVKKILL